MLPPRLRYRFFGNDVGSLLLCFGDLNKWISKGNESCSCDWLVVTVVSLEAMTVIQQSCVGPERVKHLVIKWTSHADFTWCAWNLNAFTYFEEMWFGHWSLWNFGFQ